MVASFAPSREAALEDSKQVRGPRLVAKVLEATIEELARVGYGQLSIEHVAERAEVNKVTIYRRWPTKLDLARAALYSVTDAEVDLVDTGSLRGDMIEHLRKMRGILESPTHRALLRVLFGGHPGDELVKLADGLRQEKEAENKVMYDRAVARGELPAGLDFDLVHAIAGGCLMTCTLFDHGLYSDAQLVYVVDVVLAGVAAVAEQRKRSRNVKPRQRDGKRARKR